MAAPITQELVRSLFHYDPDTGALIWKLPTARKRKQGAEAGYIATVPNSSRQYRAIGIGRCLYKAHRLVWLYVYGELPMQIDHIDTNSLNNRIGNLRPCNDAQNAANRRASLSNKSGLKGASFSKRSGRWRASIFHHGKTVNLGDYDTPEEAHAIYAAKAAELFGAFARAA